MNPKTTTDGGGLRSNEGKSRHDLTAPYAQEQYAKVMTLGAQKYAENNWRRGMSWSKVLASLERHLQAIKRGEDYDKESGLLHAAHVMTNAAFLTEYYKIYPQGDDRPHSYLNQLKIGLDVDEILSDFVGGMMERFPEMKTRPVHWNDPYISKHFEEIRNDENFWMGLKPNTKSEDLHFEPSCYITARPVPPELTKKWLLQNGFPDAPVYSVGHNESKVDVAKKSGIDMFVDDSFRNFVELNKAGILTYLFDAPHNQKYEVGYRRIKSLKELK